MAVTSFDGNFSFRQDSLARLGHRDTPGMTADQYSNFLNSPFMQGVRRQDAATEEKTSKRDLKRRRTDPTFQPKDTDWDAPKSHTYDAEINYYKVLGIDEYSSNDEVKKAYRHLSLIYHPDKTAGKSQEEKEEYAAIFIELKNAYKTLADQPTRRQYDRERDRLVAGHEVNGYHLRKRAHFDATKVLQELEKRKRPEGKTVTINVSIKLEKVFYGGTKNHRMRRRKEKYGDFFEEDVTFRLDCTKGCLEGKEIFYKGQGDAQRDTQADNLKFIINSKPHEHLTRKGNDLHLKKAVSVADPSVWSKPEMMLETAAIGGRYIIIWGRNPFYGRPKPASGEVRFAMHGEGLVSEDKNPGALHFKTILGKQSSLLLGSTAIIVFKNLKTDAEVHIEIEDPNNTTVGQAKKKVMDCLGISSFQKGALRCVKEADGHGGTYIPLNETTKIGDMRKVLCTGEEWKGAQMNAEGARQYLNLLIKECESEHFQAAARGLPKLQGRTKELNLAVKELLMPLGRWLAKFGFPLSEAGWARAMAGCTALASDHEDVRALLERVDDLCNPKKLTDPSRWAAAGLLESKASLLPADQPDAERHPAMVRRVAKQQQQHLICSVEMQPVDPKAAPIYLLTKPSCSLTLYSNLRQSASCPQGQVRPRPTFAAVLSCPAGAKKTSRMQWQALCQSIAPLLQCSLWKMLPQARGLLPKSLPMIPAWDKYGAEWQEERQRLMAEAKRSEEEAKPIEEGKVDPASMKPEEEPEEEDDEEEEVEDDEEVEDEEKQDESEETQVPDEPEEEEEQSADDSEDEPTVTSAGNDGGFFDFDELEELEQAAEKAREKKQRKEERRNAREERKRQRERLKQERIEALAKEKKRKIEMRENEKRAARLRKELERQKKKAKKFAPPPRVCTPVDSSGPLMPWKKLGDEAFRRGDCFTAVTKYSEALAALPCDGPSEDAAILYSNRSACLAKVGHFEDALIDAKRALELKPRWGKAHSRIGLAASKLGPEFLQEARNAYFLAVEFEPTGANVDALLAVKRTEKGGQERAHQEKENGNGANRTRDLGLAIAHYTSGIAAISPPELSGPQSSPTLEEDKFLLAVLYSNRASAFMRMRVWASALADAKKSVELKPDWPRGLCRLGSALIAMGHADEAYQYYAKAAKLVPDDKTARKGRDACLGLIPLWQSVRSNKRRNRFFMDAHRPKGSTRVFAVSDVHFDHKGADEWVHNVDPAKFQEDVLIVAGDVADTLRNTKLCLKILKSKFRRVFYTPGNHDLWMHPTEVQKYTDSIAKLLAIFEACDEMDVDVFPAAVAKDLYIMPLLSWYNADFDEKDPWPSEQYAFDKFCSWPVDPDHQLWKYMLSMNKRFLELPFHGDVITFSHFLPRQGLPFYSATPGLVKAIGCTEIDHQVRQVKARCHVFGHSHRPCNQTEDGVLYVQNPLGYEDEHGDRDPLKMVHSGFDIGCVSMPI